MKKSAHLVFGLKDPHPMTREVADVRQELGHQESHVQIHSLGRRAVVMKGTEMCPLNVQYRPSSITESKPATTGNLSSMLRCKRDTELHT